MASHAPCVHLTYCELSVDRCEWFWLWVGPDALGTLCYTHFRMNVYADLDWNVLAVILLLLPFARLITIHIVATLTHMHKTDFHRRHNRGRLGSIVRHFTQHTNIYSLTYWINDCESSLGTRTACVHANKSERVCAINKFDMVLYQEMVMNVVNLLVNAPLHNVRPQIFSSNGPKNIRSASESRCDPLYCECTTTNSADSCYGNWSPLVFSVSERASPAIPTVESTTIWYARARSYYVYAPRNKWNKSYIEILHKTFWDIQFNI